MEQNILLIGLGSIGTRHLNNLVALGYTNINIVTRLGKVKKGFEKYRFYPSIEEACIDQTFNIAIIATPTANHISDLLKILENNIKNIYIEKPIAHSLDEALKAEKKLVKSKVNIVVGYDLHFDPGLLLMKEYIDTKKIGKVVSFISEVGQYLPDWRPDIDYRKSMSANKSLGGGVMLDLVHEFDYLNWLLGPIKSIYGKNNKISNLDIDTEDVSVNIIETASGALGTLHLDYLQCEISRKCKIIGEEGVMVWNYSEATLKYMLHKERIWHVYEYNSYKRNDRFKDIIQSFMSSVNSEHDNRLVNFDAAINSLKLIKAAKKSNINNKMVDL